MAQLGSKINFNNIGISFIATQTDNYHCTLSHTLSLLLYAALLQKQ